MVYKIPPVPVGVPPGSSYWTDWYEKVRTLINGTADLFQTKLNNSTGLRDALSDETGTGFAVFNNTPTLIAPILGTPTSGNLVNTTGFPASGLSGLGAGVATFLATPSSANLATAVTDETGSGALVFANTPTLVTPVLGVATATSINKVALTAPATAATLTIANNKTLTVNNSLTLSGTDATTMTFPTTTATIARIDAAQTFAGNNSFSGLITSILGNNTNIFNSISATTGYQYFKMTNTSGGLYWGLENSTGGSWVTGSTGYDSFFMSVSGMSWSTNSGTNLHMRLSTTGLALPTAGTGLQIKTGANCKMGQAVLVGGTVTVATTAVLSTSIIFLTTGVAGGTLGVLSVGTITNATSFVINSLNVLDTSTVNWLILDPA